MRTGIHIGPVLLQAVHGLVGVLCVTVFGAGCATPAPGADAAKTIILMIGDGMGPGQIEAGRCYKGSNLVFEAMARQGAVRTFSANSNITDSAAAATAMATGHKVNNGVLSVALPGDVREYETLLEFAARKGRRTGLVTTTAMTDATPAGFGAHETNRSASAAIAEDYLLRSRPNVFLGGGGGMTAGAAAAAGYVVVTSRAELQAVATTSVSRVSGQFGAGNMPYEMDGVGALPHLSEMAACALDILEDGTNGFFLMVEGGEIDLACHANNITNCVGEVIEFDRTVGVVLSWVSTHSNTLAIVTADHETGGLQVTANRGVGQMPAVSWKTMGHTGTNTAIFAQGPGSGMVTGVIDNTDVYRVVMRTQDITPEAVGMRQDVAGGIESVWNANVDKLCRVERSDDLMATNWTTLATATALTHVVSFVDPNMPAGASRFYRLVSSP